MKKFFGALLAVVVLLTANISHAAKIQPLAEIDAYNFFRNMGYEVDCSHFEYVRGRQFYYATIPEDPLIFSKDFANVEVYAEQKKGYIVEVALYLQEDADVSAMVAIIAKTLKSLDAAAFQTNQAAIEQNVTDWLNTLTLDDLTVAIDANRQLVFSREEQHGRILMISVKVGARD